jgi:hypothetical protein
MRCAPVRRAIAIMILAACSPSRVDLKTVESDDAIADALHCHPDADGECYMFVETAAFLQRARARHEWPSELRVDGLSLDDIGDTLELVDYDEGYFRDPAVARFRTRVEFVECCHKLRACTLGAACGCNFDCNGEFP